MSTFLLVLSIAFQIVLIAALADFVSGAIHWLEDAYFTEDTPVIGPLFIRPNIVHHHLPRYFTRKTWWQSSRDLAIAGAVILLVAWPLGYFCWQLCLFVALGMNANEVHKWSHRTRQENGRIISALQDCCLLQTSRHHGLHHSDPKNTYYCPITNFVNPVLEKINFWNRLEGVVERLTGATHRADTAVRGRGPGPEWLKEYRRTPAPVPIPTLISTPAPVIPFPSPAKASSALTAQTNCSVCPRQGTRACSKHPTTKSHLSGLHLSFLRPSTRLAA